MIEQAYRTVEIRDDYGDVVYEGLFHGFFERADSKDGVPKKYVRALIEDTNGTIRFVAPNRVEFTDGLAGRLVAAVDRDEEEDERE